MSTEAAITFFLAVFIFGVTPGPGVFAVLARALHNGDKGFWLSLGMALSDCVYLVLACLGLAAVAEHWGGLFTLIRLIGAAYLLYLGWQMWHAPINLAPATASECRKGRFAAFIQGFLISASNPKVILFYIAFLPTFMDLSSLSLGDITLAVALTLIALMAGLTLIAHLAVSARRFLQSEHSARRLNRSAGSIMMAAGAYLALRH